MTGAFISDPATSIAFGIIVVLSVFMTTMQTLLVSKTAQQSSLPPGARAPVPIWVGAFLAAWFGLAMVTADGANSPHQTAQTRLLTGLLVGFGPMLAGIALLFTSKTMRLINEATRPDHLILMQTYRMAGLVFLYPFWFRGTLPTAFALPAALGDFLTGVLAPVVALAVSRRKSHAFVWAIVWNAFGILDLIVAPTAALLSQAQVLRIYALALVPLFLGPPLGILTHVYSLRNLARAARANTSGHPNRPIASPVAAPGLTSSRTTALSS
jgi:hypothetical protein